MSRSLSGVRFFSACGRAVVTGALRLVALAVGLGTVTSFAHAADAWTQFRGPAGDGRAVSAVGLPTEFSETKNVVWKTPIEGRGHSSPVVADGQIWITTSIVTPLAPEEKKKRLAGLPLSDQLELAGSLTLEVVSVSLDNGAIVRKQKLFDVADPEPIHSLNSYASPTCVLDSGKVYCCFGTFGVACLDTATGDVLWKNNELHCDHQNGPGSSPVLWKDKLIVHFDGRDEQFIAAYDAATGAVAWKTPRSGKMENNIDFKKAYGTPSIVEQNGQPVLVSPAADWVYGYDPATGNELWKTHYGVLGFSTTPKPVTYRDLTYVCTSYMKSKLLAIRTHGPHVGEIAWQSDRQIPQKPSLLVVGDELYSVSDNGVASCFDAETGTSLWQERMPGAYSASPLYADGKIYFWSQEGVCTVIKPGKKYEQLAVNKLGAGEGDGFMASPAVVGNSLIVRTNSHLYRLADKSDSATAGAAPADQNGSSEK